MYIYIYIYTTKDDDIPSYKSLEPSTNGASNGAVGPCSRTHKDPKVGPKTIEWIGREAGFERLKQGKMVRLRECFLAKCQFCMEFHGISGKHDGFLMVVQ